MCYLDTVFSLCEELNVNRKNVLETMQLTAANQATLGKARLLGYLTECQQGYPPVRSQVITGVPRKPM